MVLYIDGKEMGKVRSWREVLSLHMSLESGTVIGIEAYDSGAWFGVKADVVVGGVHFGTGGSGWKATTRLNKQELTEGLWAKQSGNSCKWKVPIGRPDGNEKFKSLGPAFPGRTNSKFVWASGAMEGESAYFRFVVGGENC